MWKMKSFYSRLSLYRQFVPMVSPGRQTTDAELTCRQRLCSVSPTPSFCRAELSGCHVLILTGFLESLPV